MKIIFPFDLAFRSAAYPENRQNQQCSGFVRQGSKALMCDDLFGDVSKHHHPSEFLQNGKNQRVLHKNIFY